MSDTNGTATPAKINGNLPAKNIKDFGTFIKSRMASIKNVAATHMRPERVYRLLVANVSKTPALQECSMESIFRSALQAVELGLEPGSAVGEGYLVPYGKQCTFIPGYRGLISLAFRSGHVLGVKANVVYQGDKFEYEEGLEPKLRHVPDFGSAREVKDITYAYCIVQLSGGGTIYDVMTRTEIENIRKRSKAGSNGPWVTDFAEMAKKTVTRRCLKYAPMSVEMSKALALENALEHGNDTIDAEFESLELDESQPEAPLKSDKLAEKIGKPPADVETIGEDVSESYTGPTVQDDEQEELGV